MVRDLTQGGAGVAVVVGRAGSGKIWALGVARKAFELDGYQVLGTAPPGSPANVDHLVVGPPGVFVIDTKQWSGSVHQGTDRLAWHHHYRLDRTLETVRWEAQTIGRLLGTHAHPLLCVHRAHVHGGGLEAQGVAVVPAHLLRGALGDDQVLSDAAVELLATTAWTGLRPAA